MMSNLYLSPLWTSTPGRRGEERSVRDRNTEWEGEMARLMEWWHKKWTHSLLHFAKTPINQFFSKVYLDSLHQDVHFPSYFSSTIACFSFLLFNGSPALKRTFNSIYSSHLFHVTLLSSPIVSCCLYCSLISTAPLSLTLSLSPLSPSLCYVCCLAALSFTCQLGSGLWSSNMTNCPLIHTHARRHKKCAHL